jgi:hypothetical protein
MINFIKAAIKQAMDLDEAIEKANKINNEIIEKAKKRSLESGILFLDALDIETNNYLKST